LSSCETFHGEPLENVQILCKPALKIGNSDEPCIDLN
jgi:hypothetical protein